MTRLVIELSEDIRFEDGTWQPADERATALVQALTGVCTAPRRLFTRPAAALDRERIALGSGARELPDLNLFYLVTGDAAVIGALPLVAGVNAVEAVAPALDLSALGPSAHVVTVSGEQPLADAIDVGGASVEHGGVLVVGHPLSTRSEWAAAELAARRQVRVLVTSAGEAPAWARAVSIVPADELVEDAVAVAGAVAAARPGRAQLILESVLLAEGGDLGTSELYLEGWVDDDDHRTAFRVPTAGAIHGVRRGDTLNLDAVVYAGERPVSGELAVHIEVWEEDLGRGSLLNPDDLLGIVDARFGRDLGWGEGRHEGVSTTGGEGRCLLTYRIEVQRDGA